MLTSLFTALFLAATESPGRGDDAGLGGNIVIIAVIALLVLGGIIGWLTHQRRS